MPMWNILYFQKPLDTSDVQHITDRKPDFCESLELVYYAKKGYYYELLWMLTKPPQWTSWVTPWCHAGMLLFCSRSDLNA